MSEAQLVAATGLFAFALVVPPLVALIMRSGFKVALGNRDDVPPLPEWSNRATRAQRNMVDTLVPFIAIVLANCGGGGGGHGSAPPPASPSKALSWGSSTWGNAKWAKK